MLRKIIGFYKQPRLDGATISIRQMCGVIAMAITWLLLFGNAKVLAQCPDDMAAFWTFNESDPKTFVDEISGLPAFCAGECPQSIGSGRVGRARRFDGTTQKLAVLADGAFNWGAGDSFTIEHWLKTSGDIPAHDDFTIGRFDPGAGLLWSIGVSSQGMVFFRILDKQGIIHFLIETTQLVNDGRWHHVAVVGDKIGLELKIYVDGRERAARPFDFEAILSSENADLTIGWSNATNENLFQGDLDEIALWRTALSPDEVRRHFHNGLADFRWGYCDDPKTIRIMPLGDSITAGVETLPDGSDLPVNLMVSYRQALYLDLAGNGYSVDFVGSQSYGQAVLGFDAANEAYPGFSDQQIARMVHGLLMDNPADIVLLHIGTNGLNIDPGDVETILDEIDRYDQETTVVLAQIINRKSFSQTTSDFNANLETMAMQRMANGDKIILVDMENAIIYPDDLSDNLHPNESGYEKMAMVWLDALSYGGAFDRRAPIIETDPVEEGAIGSVYVYDVDADGLPTPRYRFAMDSTVPDGMSIDENSGLIQWLVSRDGAFPIIVEAYNSEGSTQQAFTITVPFTNQPPVADAGAGKTVLEGATVMLDGTGSSDPDGGIARYGWRQVSGAQVTLSNPASPTPTFIAPEQDVAGLIFELTVTDKGGLSDTDEVRIAINSNGIDIFPEGVAGFTTVTGEVLGVRVDSGGALVFLESVQDQTFSDTDGRPQDFIYGMVGAELRLDAHGGTAVVTFFLPSSAPDGYRWYGYSATDGWMSFGDAAVFNEDRTQVQITVTDGGIGDESTEAGVIELRSGLAVMPAPEKAEKDELISCFIHSVFDGAKTDRRTSKMVCFFTLTFLGIAVARLKAKDNGKSRQCRVDTFPMAGWNK